MKMVWILYSIAKLGYVRSETAKQVFFIKHLSLLDPRAYSVISVVKPHQSRITFLIKMVACRFIKGHLVREDRVFARDVIRCHDYHWCLRDDIAYV